MQRFRGGLVFKAHRGFRIVLERRDEGLGAEKPGADVDARQRDVGPCFGLVISNQLVN